PGDAADGVLARGRARPAAGLRGEQRGRWRASPDGMGTERSKGSACPEEWTTRHGRELRMQQLGRGQRQLITASQLQNLGYAKSTIHDRVAAGRLHPTPFAAVYSLAPAPLGRLETIKAAALSCGHPSLPSHW